MDDIIVESIEELEELYTKNIITYYQYLNIKDTLKNKKDFEKEQSS